MLPYALAIFTGAFLLFQVQPLIGKYILPWFGGGPGVWTTCLLFFQVALLGGYAYAHLLTSRFRPKTQAIVHASLLLVACLLLPIAPGEGWKSHVAGDPTWRILLLLGGVIGLPYFVLSATGPLIQRWFSYTYPQVSPYRLYALSNVGSLLALLSYPTFFEVKLARHTQAVLWSGGFVLFLGLCVWCARSLWRLPAPASAAPATTESNSDAADDPRSSFLDKALWVILPAIASALLLATTNKLCQEVAVIPFLWVLPLSLYLLTFILCFDHARWYVRPVFAALLAVGVMALLQLDEAGARAPLRLQIVVYTATLFFACMFCHGELYALKPAPRRLTGFYLAISAGGALGGTLVAVVAPLLFIDFHELPLAMWALTYVAGVVCFRHRSVAMAWGAACGLALATFVLPAIRGQLSDGLSYWGEWQFFYTEQRWLIFTGVAVFLLGAVDWRTRQISKAWRPGLGSFMMALSVAAGVWMIIKWNPDPGVRIVESSRNFYGTLRVYEYEPEIPENHYYLLLHGATTHGLQFAATEHAMRQTTYYGPASGVGLALRGLPRPAGQRRLGLVGLGTGTLAAYGEAGDHLKIYEINPDVIRLARTRFTFLQRCPAQVDVVLGDARLTMEQELKSGGRAAFDLLALDAFSSDAIPVHLLTKEAVAMYLDLLAPDGVLAVHTSNRYLDLEPVVERLAAEFGLKMAIVEDDDPSDWWVYRTTWILLTRNEAFLKQPEIADRSLISLPVAGNQPLWTDDFASLFSVLR